MDQEFDHIYIGGLPGRWEGQGAERAAGTAGTSPVSDPVQVAAGHGRTIQRHTTRRGPAVDREFEQRRRPDPAAAGAVGRTDGMPLER